jgi:large subunit ribosomal protein L4e
MAYRQVTTVQTLTPGAKPETIPIPRVFLSPIRDDLVRCVHRDLAKNARQAYAVSDKAGMQSSAESWGTGRAVSRVPRVPGSGTHRAGQGAFANMCRGGRMFSPTKIWRRWHRKVNINQRRYAVCSALAASALPPLVMARGHRISQVPEIPLVIDDNDFKDVKKTKKAVEILKALHAYEDVEKVKESRNIRCGKGKMRNRRYVQRKGPLIVYGRDSSFLRAFRNIPGIELCNVRRLNLLQLAPGGHLGRFIIWTKDAFKQLNDVFGTPKHDAKFKTDYRPPRAIITNPDITGIINSEDIQSVLRDKKPRIRCVPRKKNPLKNFGVMVRLNPFALAARRRQLLLEQKRRKQKRVAQAKKIPLKKRSLKRNVKTMRKQRLRFYQQILLKEQIEEKLAREAEYKKAREESATAKK